MAAISPITQNELTPRQSLIAFAASCDEVAKADVTKPLGFLTSSHLANHLLKCIEALGPTPKEKSRSQKLALALILTGHALDRSARGTKEPAYHNRNHNILVASVRFLRGLSYADTHNRHDIDFYTNELRDLAAAMGHDLGHDGTSNSAGGAYNPARLELIATSKLDRIMQAAQLDEADQLHMRRTIWCSDPQLPGEMLFHAANHHELGSLYALPRADLLTQIDKAPEGSRGFLTDLLAALEQDKELTVSALALKSADMVPAFGLSPGNSLDQVRKIETELLAYDPDPVQTRNGRMIAEKRLFVMINFIGARLCQQTGQIAPCYPDTESQKLFGAALDTQFALHIGQLAEPVDPQSLLICPRQPPASALR